MKHIADLFFNNNYHVHGIDDSEYTKLPILFESLNIIGPQADLGFYIIDYYQKKVIFLSDNITKWGGITLEYIERYGIDFISDKDIDMLIEINNAFFNFLSTKHYEQYTLYNISYNFRFISNKVQYLINQTYSPLQIRHGRIWLALCTITLSSRSTRGNIVIRKKGSDFIYRYSLEKHIWNEEELINLTEIEILIIRYSAQGLTNETIAKKLFKSVDSIKSYKKKMYKKLKVHSMPEAIVYSQNQGLL